MTSHGKHKRGDCGGVSWFALRQTVISGIEKLTILGVIGAALNPWGPYCRGVRGGSGGALMGYVGVERRYPLVRLYD